MENQLSVRLCVNSVLEHLAVKPESGFTLTATQEHLLQFITCQRKQNVDGAFAMYECFLDCPQNTFTLYVLVVDGEGKDNYLNYEFANYTAMLQHMRIHLANYMEV